MTNVFKQIVICKELGILAPFECVCFDHTLGESILQGGQKICSHIVPFSKGLNFNHGNFGTYFSKLFA
jgi:hypothetical protein